MKSASAAFWQQKTVGKKPCVLNLWGETSNLLWFPLAKSCVWNTSGIHSVQLRSKCQSINYAVSYCFALVRCWAHFARSWTKRGQHLFWSFQCLFQCSPFWGYQFQQKPLIHEHAHQLHPMHSTQPDTPSLTHCLAELGLWWIAFLSESDSSSEWIGWNVPCLDAFKYA